MEKIKQIKECLIAQVQAQTANLEQVDAKELGEVVDMIKDLADTMKLCEEEKYYKKIVESMEESKKEKEIMDKMREYGTPQHISQHYYPIYHDDYMMRDMDRDMGRMYYRGQPRDSQGRFESPRGGNGNTRGYGEGGNGGLSSSTGGTSGGRYGYDEPPYYHMPLDSSDYPHEMRDVREGRSPMSRRSYMESKELNKGREVQMQELEKYMQELATDITEMIKDATPEEKQVLQQKLTVLASKMK